MQEEVKKQLVVTVEDVKNEDKPAAMTILEMLAVQSLLNPMSEEEDSKE